MKLINKDNSFLSKRNIYSITQYKECLEKYSKNFEEEISLATTSPIFLDTNVLLRYYSISFTAREKLFEFIDSNKSRIILTPQVQYEFIKNREDVIQRFFEQVTNKIPKDFNSDVVNKMKSFLDNHKVVLKDYSFVETGITKHKNELEEILSKLNETVDHNRKELTNLIVKDKFLDLLTNCVHYEGLTDDEIQSVKKDFDTLKKDIQLENIDSAFNKTNSIFPGLGDIKNKPEEPYGDYIIFHEMMKYMMNKKADTIFLTFDNSKGDWMNKNKSPHLHYTQNMYANTQQLLYITDAERALEELLDVNIESLVPQEVFIHRYTAVTEESLSEFVGTFPFFKNGKIAPISSLFVEELISNGILFIEDIKDVLIRAEQAILTYHTRKAVSPNCISLIRVGLKIVFNSYLQTMKDGNKKQWDLDSLKPYHQFRNLLTNKI